MADCLFCKIISGEIPSTKVFENDKVCFTTDKEFTRLKIFVLESLESMKPVCKAEEIR